MPKVDPETGQPLPDDPDGPLETRGGMEAGNPGLQGATEVGRGGPSYRETGSKEAEPDRTLPAERGGSAGGSGQAGG